MFTGRLHTGYWTWKRNSQRPKWQQWRNTPNHDLQSLKWFLTFPKWSDDWLKNTKRISQKRRIDNPNSYKFHLTLSLRFSQNIVYNNCKIHKQQLYFLNHDKPNNPKAKTWTKPNNCHTRREPILNCTKNDSLHHFLAEIISIRVHMDTCACTWPGRNRTTCPRFFQLPHKQAKDTSRCRRLSLVKWRHNWRRHTWSQDEWHRCGPRSSVLYSCIRQGEPFFQYQVFSLKVRKQITPKPQAASVALNCRARVTFPKATMNFANTGSNCNKPCTQSQKSTIGKVDSQACVNTRCLNTNCEQSNKAEKQNGRHRI